MTGVRARGTTGILIDFQYRGARCRETLKMEPTKENLRWARSKRDQIVSEIEKGEFWYGDHFPQSKRAEMLGQLPKEILTVGRALDKWMEAHRSLVQPSTAKLYGHAIDALKEELGNLRLTDLTPGVLHSYISKHADLEAQNSALHNRLVPLRQMLDLAVADGVLQSNPMRRVKDVLKRLPRNVREPEPFTPDEIKRLLGVMTEMNVRAYFQTAIFTGMRPSELIALQWDDVDFEAGIITVRRSKVMGKIKKPKTAAGVRKIIMLPQARQALSIMVGSHPQFVFVTDKCEPWADERTLRDTYWEAAIAASGLKRREPYQCRHTFASLCLSAGEDVFTVARMMGHSGVQVIQKTYARWMPSVSRFGDKVAQAAGGMPAW